MHEKSHTKLTDGLKYDECNEPILRCNICCRDFKKISSLKMHLKFKCNGILKSERKIYSYKCPVQHCSKKYPTRKATAKHLSVIHQIQIEKLENFCFECNAEFDDYMNHVKQHSCDFECRLCSKRFLTEGKLVEHMAKLHSDVTEKRPHKCTQCEASFKSENHLRQHKGMRHSTKDDQKFSCDFCNRKCAFKYMLNQHMKSHVARSFECDLCHDINYRKLESLKQHFLSVHGHDCVHRCTECHERFKLHIDMKTHRQQEHGTGIHKYFET